MMASIKLKYSNYIDMDEFLASMTSIKTYVHDLEERVLFLQRNLDQTTRENVRLKDNEKEMFKVSSIIAASNENAKLKSYISILEEQLHKRSDKVVYDSEANARCNDEEYVDVVIDKTTKEICLDIKPNAEEVQPIVIHVEEASGEDCIVTMEEECLNNICEVLDTHSTDTVSSLCNVSCPNIESQETEEMRQYTYKGILYLMDENNMLYENVEDEKGAVVGRRKWNKKTSKWKTIIEAK
ncbi:hypothetical protein QKU58_gp136 [Pyramimonas orientalis virus]|uniref:Uncharacterized protein n=1 Tax=Pyramimonas orientalis virus 01B TaxID=3134525 RepID=A0A7M3UNE6_9VIRU|nr:hypothetical protein QKU58_gp136 [Pyramimonas orientalis virus]QOI90195.1 hypothetical protein HWQ62_00058 [Pyramimonas orientalis virus]